jgi:hypothetical protein
MKDNQFTLECAYGIMDGLGADVAAVKECEGDSDLDQPIPLLEVSHSNPSWSYMDISRCEKYRCKFGGSFFIRCSNCRAPSPNWVHVCLS